MVRTPDLREIHKKLKADNELLLKTLKFVYSCDFEAPGRCSACENVMNVAIAKTEQAVL